MNVEKILKSDILPSLGFSGILREGHVYHMIAKDYIEKKCAEQSRDVHASESLKRQYAEMLEDTEKTLAKCKETPVLGYNFRYDPDSNLFSLVAEDASGSSIIAGTISGRGLKSKDISGVQVYGKKLPTASKYRPKTRSLSGKIFFDKRDEKLVLEGKYRGDVGGVDSFWRLESSPIQ
jgi:hypothetical protein